jgi:hypothetical protein
MERTVKYAVLRTVKQAALFSIVALTSVSAFAADRIEGRVEGGGRAIAKAEVTLWVTGPAGPKKLAETQATNDGRFEVTITGDEESAGVLYLIAKGPNPAITLMATLGTAPPQHVTINELTTVASAWTAAQFLKGHRADWQRSGIADRRRQRAEPRGARNGRLGTSDPGPAEQFVDDHAGEVQHAGQSAVGLYHSNAGRVRQAFLGGHAARW